VFLALQARWLMGAGGGGADEAWRREVTASGYASDGLGFGSG